MHDNVVRRFRWWDTGEISDADLVRACGEKLTDRALWTQFQERFQGLIFLYLMRSLSIWRIHEDATGIVPDLAQEMYLRLVQHDGRILRSFRGSTEFSVKAFLARIASSVATDYRRRTGSRRRKGEVIPIESAEAAEQTGRPSADSPEFDSTRLSSILAWIDIERIVDGETDRKNAQRNALIFKLHYIDGFGSDEISRFPGFDLTRSGVETILTRLRKRIQE
jgi:RNA polymerase sigma factor (sigma-70 family)